MFEKGNLVIAVNGNYAYTNEHTLCVVVENHGGEIRVVPISGHYTGECFRCAVPSKDFRKISIEEFEEKFPNELIKLNLIREYDIPVSEEWKTQHMPLPSIMDKTVRCVLSNSEKEKLLDEILEVIDSMDYYNPTKSAIRKIIDEWELNNGWIIEMFKNHPNYDGKYKIVFDEDYYRTFDSQTIYNFSRWIENSISKILPVVQIGDESFEELEEKFNLYTHYNRAVEYIKRYSTEDIKIGEKSASEIHNIFEQLDAKMNEYHESVEIRFWQNKPYLIEDLDKRDRISNFSYILSNRLANIGNPLASEELVNEIKNWFPDIDIVKGQKISRIVNKICTVTGLASLPDYNKEFAKFADAINPLKIKRHTVLSCHPVDYLLMSNGNSWHSCHSIDLNHVNGCYSSGTISYMLDNSSIVFYTVDASYNGQRIEKEKKITRCMFHLGEDKIVQGRVYPQCTDGATDIYKTYREIVQKVIADCLDVPNLWTNVKGTDACSAVINSYGTHYEDYDYQRDCNVSFLKRNAIKNTKKIDVGHDPICIRCGEEHEYTGSIQCDDCNTEPVYCSHCGAWISDDPDDSGITWVDGEAYCSDCAFYCEYHGCYEVEESYYVEGYGYVCEDALGEGDFMHCDHCGEWYYSPDIKPDENGVWFCSDGCGESEDYFEYEGQWYSDEDYEICYNCGRVVSKRDYDFGADCCNECAREIERSA